MSAPHSPAAGASSPAASTLACDTLTEAAAFEASKGWADGTGWEFDLTMAFDRVSADTGEVEGRSTWVLRGVPARHAALGGKIGRSAVEHFRGETSGRSVTVKGHVTDDPHDIIACGQYVLAIVKQRDMWQHESDEESEDEDEAFSPYDSRSPPQKQRHQIALGKCAGRHVQMIRYRQQHPKQRPSPPQRELSPMADRTNAPEPEPEPELARESCTPSRAAPEPAAEPFLPWSA